MPSDEVLAHFVAVRCYGPGAGLAQRLAALRLIRDVVGARAVWLREHAAFEEQLRRHAGAAA